eukprot:CAMPEP_0183455696 /NCGR_PEP_ID=MMETSP0370-20130417/127232_1 /TAXON_ID=268820 /ORGANISM="Peridinium aciculiferum, Strain PAER-2" /LENGTH=251 /DNA_ID=CAMNT_0025647295 /DNA_START=9 /DNA_END=761 /DNA_ORIENTATION=+
MKRSDMVRLLKGQDDESLPPEVVVALNQLKTFKGAAALPARLQELAELEAKSDEGLARGLLGAGGATAGGEGGKEEGEYLEEGRLKDATGIARQRKKVRKALKRQAWAQDNAEEADVPDTANALFQLKSQRGEGFWDFSDAEVHSDDEEEENFESHLAGPGHDNEEAVMAEDEEHADAQKQSGVMSSHGEEIERLLRAHERVSLCVAPGQVSMFGMEDPEMEEDDELSEGEACATKNLDEREQDNEYARSV